MFEDSRALLLLACAALLGLWGTPGLDYLDPVDYDTAAERAKLRAEKTPLQAEFTLAAHAFNRSVRLPIYQWVDDPQRVFRIRQSWHLYRDGPQRIARLEIWADDALLYRTADPAFPWHAEIFRDRRMRPVVESSTWDPEAANWRGLLRLCVERVQAEHPATRRVALKATRAAFPGTGDVTVHHVFEAAAPAWTPSVVVYEPGADGAPAADP